ncbi:MAG: ferrous iron transporter B, partial [Deltaproteobacteria bacterium]|nr:ferrous iron transporter B [Deltaproteobacteria bacterium]
AIVIVLSFLNSVGTDGTFGHEDSGSSLLAAIGKGITPVFYPLGIHKENWPATVGLFTGVFAKEAVVGTLNSLYSAEAQTGEEEEGFNLVQGIKDAFSSIPENLSGLAGSLADPLGIGSATEEAPEEMGKSTFGVMGKRFDGKVGAFAYLLFVLLYIPCLVAVATIYRETNARWAVFEVVYTIFVAWVVSTLFYQMATFGKHPAASLAWVIGIGFACAVLYYVMKRAGRKLLLLAAKGRPTIGPAHETLPVFQRIR